MKDFIEKLIQRLEERKKIILSHKIVDAEDESMVFAYNETINIVNQLAEEYNNGWIPCSERLPSKEEFLKDDGRFIVTDGNRRYESCYDIYTKCFKTLKLFDFNSDGRNSRFVYDGLVIAWQPLPAPYKEGE